jgi:MFS family permease
MKTVSRPLGAAACISAVLNGKLLDWYYRRLARKLNMPVDRKRGDDLRHFPIERARITSVFFVNALQSATILCYGWVLQQHAPLAVPLVFQFIMGICIVGSANSMSTLLIDLFPDRPSTASAAMNLLRCVFGAIGAGVIDDMLTNMGYGWAFVLQGLLVALASILLWAEVKYGMQWRGKRWDRLAEKKKEEEKKKQERQRDAKVDKI